MRRTSRRRRTRQARVTSGRVTWTQERFEPAGRISDLAKAHPAVREALARDGIDPNAQPVPARDRVTVENLSLVFDGGRMYSIIQNAAHPQAGQQSAFDGKAAKNLTLRTNHHPTGMIEHAAHSHHAQLSIFRPVLFTFRPFNPHFLGFHVPFRDTGRAGIIDGASCPILESVERAQFNTTTRTIWVDPARDYNILRYTVHGDSGLVALQIDVSYSRSADVGWRPDGWKIQRFGKENTIRTQTSASHVKFEFNPSLGDKDFDLVFPVGTVVADERHGVSHVVQQNLAARPILPADEGATHEELMQTKPGHARLSRSLTPLGWFIAINLAIAISLTAVIIYRRIRWS
jgi:hypothetical protein